MPDSGDPEAQAVLRRAAELDATQLAIASRLGSPPLDLLAIYLPGLDIAQQALLGSGGSVSPSVLSARLEAMRGYYIYLDTALRELVAPVAGEMIIVIAQPGRIPNVPHGMLAASGDGSARVVAAAGRAVDVAPTVLHALGIPISRALAGGPVLGIFAPEFSERFPVRHVETYGRRVRPDGAREGRPLDREMIERLKSLGYVR
jgi:hypothetical protein